MNLLKKTAKDVWEECTPDASEGTVAYYWEKINHAYGAAGFGHCNAGIQGEGLDFRGRGKGFLTCREPEDAFDTLSRRIAFLSLNPGDKTEYPADRFADSPAYEITACNAEYFFYEEWDGDNSGGKAPLQVQLQRFFLWLHSYFREQKAPGILEKQLPIPSPLAEEVAQWTEKNVLSAYFIPFRSQCLRSKGNDDNSLKYPDESLAFAKLLWADIFKRWTPAYIFVIDRDSFNSLKSEDFGIYTHKESGYIGWGNVKYEVGTIEKGGKKTILARLPHLSRYKIFSQEKCREKIEAFFKAVFA